MKDDEARGRIFAGILLIAVGLLALAAIFFDISATLGLLILPGMGLAFVVWGLLSRESGLLIPGGILSGIGVGTLLITGPFQNSSGEVQGGIFMLAFAAGWFLIPILSQISTGDNHWWALIPGALMAIIGGGLLFGGVAFAVLQFLGRIWPVFLILGGLFLLLKRSGKTKTV